jgi:hypothetical protein
MKPMMLLCNPKRPPAAQLLETPGKRCAFNCKFTSKTAITTANVAYMTRVLESIHDEFGSKINIKNNKTITSKAFKFDEPEDFAKNYKTHHFCPTKPQGGPNRAWFLFCVRTSQSLSTIRKFLMVTAVVQRRSCHFVFHPWMEDIPDIQSIGFLLGPLPKYQTSDTF